MYLQKFHNIKVFVFDIDGVLTDGTVLVTDEGHQLRSFNIKDGYALHRAVKAGYHVIVISGGDSIGAIFRLKKLGITDIHISVRNKEAKLVECLQTLGLDKSTCLVMGDDMPDIPMLKMAGCSTCPADAVPEIKYNVDYVSPFNGGKGCVRDVIQQVMTLSGRW